MDHHALWCQLLDVFTALCCTACVKRRLNGRFSGSAGGLGGCHRAGPVVDLMLVDPGLSLEGTFARLYALHGGNGSPVSALWFRLFGGGWVDTVVLLSEWKNSPVLRVSKKCSQA